MRADSRRFVLEDKFLPAPAKGKKAPTILSVTLREAMQATGSEKPELNQRLIKQTIEALWIPAGASEIETIERTKAAIALLQGIRPSDEVEGMLAAQMVATHSAAMECLRRAMVPEQTFAGRDQNLKHAAKLLQVYSRQMDVLNRNRGKGQQKVTVEHVHVGPGGQAMVGNFETSGKSQSSGDHSSDGPKSIPFTPAEELNLSVTSKVPIEKSRKSG